MTANLMQSTLAAVCGCVGVLVVSFFTQYFSVDRKSGDDRIARRRQFLSFLDRWNFNFQRASTLARVTARFEADIAAFESEVCRIRPDFRGDQRQEFNALVATVSVYINPRNQAVPDADKKLMAAIDALVLFIKEL